MFGFSLLSPGVCFASVELSLLVSGSVSGVPSVLETMNSLFVSPRQHSVFAGETNAVESERATFLSTGSGEREARRGGRCPRAAGPQVCIWEPEVTERQVPLNGENNCF